MDSPVLLLKRVRKLVEARPSPAVVTESSWRVLRVVRHAATTNPSEFPHAVAALVREVRRRGFESTDAFAATCTLADELAVIDAAIAAIGEQTFEMGGEGHRLEG